MLPSPHAQQFGHKSNFRYDILGPKLYTKFEVAIAETWYQKLLLARYSPKARTRIWRHADRANMNKKAVQLKNQL